MTNFRTVPQVQVIGGKITGLPNTGQLEAAVEQRVAPHAYEGTADRCLRCGLLREARLHVGQECDKP